MARMWMPGAAVLKASRDGGSMIGGPARHTDHTVEAPYTWTALQTARYLNSVGSSSTIALHPITGHIVQMIPADRAARALMNLSGGVQTNRQGRYNIQSEVIGYAKNPWTRDLTDAGKRAVAARANWLDTLGVEREWQMGHPAATYAEANSAGFRNAWKWVNRGGYTCHSRCPENGHWDCGSVDMKAAMGLGKSSGGGGIILTPSAVGAEWFAPDDLSVSTIKALQKAVGVKADGVMGPKTAKATQEWLKVAVDGDWGRNTVTALQKRVGVTADGIWGPKTANGLRRYLGRDADGGEDLKVDGLMGAQTVRAIEKWLGLPVKGTWTRWDIKALQRRLGVNADGVLGPVTVRALQRRVGTKPDGDWGKNTTKALQRYLNKAL